MIVRRIFAAVALLCALVLPAHAQKTKAQIVAEPVSRNTAPAIGLAAFLLYRDDPNAIIGMFPADHVISDEKRFRKVLQRSIEIAAKGENIVVMGIRPSRAGRSLRRRDCGCGATLRR